VIDVREDEEAKKNGVIQMDSVPTYNGNPKLRAHTDAKWFFLLLFLFPTLSHFFLLLIIISK